MVGVLILREALSGQLGVRRDVPGEGDEIARWRRGVMTIMIGGSRTRFAAPRLKTLAPGGGLSS